MRDRAERLAELMAGAKTYFIPASGRYLAEIPGFAFRLWAVAEDEPAAKIRLSGRVAEWLKEKGR